MAGAQVARRGPAIGLPGGLASEAVGGRLRGPATRLGGRVRGQGRGQLLFFTQAVEGRIGFNGS